jgi:pyruvate dehydrogenase E2 component (dihydrolipoamide acetyltransferase)
MAIVEVNVPDIGDFNDVPVIEVLVKPGDTVKAEDSLVTLESDKATMDVPAPSGGVVKSVVVKVGDKVSKGSALLTLDRRGRGTAASRRRHPRRPRHRHRHRPRRPPRNPRHLHRPLRRRALVLRRTPAAPTSSARCSSSAQVPAAIRRRFARQTSG